MPPYSHYGLEESAAGVSPALSKWLDQAGKEQNKSFSLASCQKECQSLKSKLCKVIWDKKTETPRNVAEQEPYRTLEKIWAPDAERSHSRAPWAADCEATRLMNGGVLPQSTIKLLKDAGFDAKKCCDPNLTREQKRLAPVFKTHKRSSRDRVWQSVAKRDFKRRRQLASGSTKLQTSSTRASTSSRRAISFPRPQSFQSLGPSRSETPALSSPVSRDINQETRDLTTSPTSLQSALPANIQSTFTALQSIVEAELRQHGNENRQKTGLLRQRLLLLNASRQNMKKAREEHKKSQQELVRVRKNMDQAREDLEKAIEQDKQTRTNLDFILEELDQDLSAAHELIDSPDV